jgi:vancomycin permeability regulator SanA
VWPGYFGPVASHALADRTLTAVDLYKSKQADCIVLTGANSIYGAHEVDIMTDLVLKEGVPEDVIELDRDGTNTLTSIEHLDTTRTYLLVSNDFHLARIHLLAKRVGTKHRLFAAQYGRGSGLHGMSARYSRESYFIIREVFAWWYYFFATLL